MAKSDQVLCMYHANCMDGFFSAAVVLYRHSGDDVQVRPMQYEGTGTAQRQQYADVKQIEGFDRIYIVDFSFPAEVLEVLAKQNAEVVMIDHHKTIDAEVKVHPLVIFDEGHCGAVLTWRRLMPGEDLPTLLAYVEDRDLWRWELMYSREVSAGLRLEVRDPHDAYRLLKEYMKGEQVMARLIQAGEVVRLYQQQEVARICREHTQMVECKETQEWVPMVNSPVLQSEIGEYLVKNPVHKGSGLPLFAVIWWETKNGSRIYSLRSDGSEGGRNFDVGTYARNRGGGGHRNAAGFKRVLATHCPITGEPV